MLHSYMHVLAGVILLHGVRAVERVPGVCSILGLGTARAAQVVKAQALSKLGILRLSQACPKRAYKGKPSHFKKDSSARQIL